MPRSVDSDADRELTARLAASGLDGSSARYERWRRAGLLPRHERHGAGRGRGSISTLASETVEIAAALARHAVQGRDLRETVVAWFFEAGRPVAPGEPAVPEPPDAVVAGALAWAVRKDPGYRMMQRAREAVTEAQRDEFYTDALRLTRRGPDSTPGFDPAAVREALLSGRDIPNDALGSGGTRTDIVHYIAALGMGVEEVGAAAFADSIVATGLFPQMSAEQWHDIMIEAEASGTYAETFAELTRFDPAEALENADIEQLRRAREVATGLAGFGAILMMHALLMPDTPALAALRASINERGLGPALMGLTQQTLRPRGVACAIAACIQPLYLELYDSLMEVVAAGPPLLHEAGVDEHDPESYMATWLSSIRKLGERSHIRSGIARRTSRRSGA